MFADRKNAGQTLITALKGITPKENSIVLALPRGGVPVGYEIAKYFHIPLDVYLVRKLGFPTYPEFAIGAIAEHGTLYLNDELAMPKEELKEIIQKEQKELDRRKNLYRGDRKSSNLLKKTIILVDDGLATGATIKATLLDLHKQDPEKIIVAVPVAPHDLITEIEKMCDKVICPIQPEDFHAVGAWYNDFSQTTDEEVLSLLEKAQDFQKSSF